MEAQRRLPRATATATATATAAAGAAAAGGDGMAAAAEAAAVAAAEVIVGSGRKAAGDTESAAADAGAAGGLGAHAMLDEQAARSGEAAAEVEVEVGCVDDDDGHGGRALLEGHTPYDMVPLSQGLISHERREQYERQGAVRQHRPLGRVPTLLPSLTS